MSGFVIVESLSVLFAEFDRRVIQVAMAASESMERRSRGVQLVALVRAAVKN